MCRRWQSDRSVKRAVGGSGGRADLTGTYVRYLGSQQLPVSTVSRYVGVHCGRR